MLDKKINKLTATKIPSDITNFSFTLNLDNITKEKVVSDAPQILPFEIGNKEDIEEDILLSSRMPKHKILSGKKKKKYKY